MTGFTRTRRSALARIAAATVAVLIAAMALVPIATAAPRAVLGELFSASG